MKKSPFLLLILLATGCQKELSTDVLEPGLAGNIQGLLQKVEVIDIPQNRVYLSQLFSYDEAGKPQRITSSTNFSLGGSNLNGIGTTTFVRDAQGRNQTSLQTAGDVGFYWLCPKPARQLVGRTKLTGFMVAAGAWAI